MKDDHNPAIPNTPLPDWEMLGQIPIVDNGENLQPTSLASDPIYTYPAYFKMGIPGALPECHLRMGAFNRLLAACAHLPNGYRLIVLDAWRPFAVQQYLYDKLISRLESSPEKTIFEARDMISPPSHLRSAPSPHITGGSIDITLADNCGRLLNMGTFFDEMNALSYTASLENISSPSPEQIEARTNRRILYNAMIAAGFTNLPSEWWHFDFGNQLWAWFLDKKQAIYSTTSPHTWDVWGDSQNAEGS